MYPASDRAATRLHQRLGRLLSLLEFSSGNYEYIGAISSTNRCPKATASITFVLGSDRSMDKDLRTGPKSTTTCWGAFDGSRCTIRTMRQLRG